MNHNKKYAAKQTIPHPRSDIPQNQPSTVQQQRSFSVQQQQPLSVQQQQPLTVQPQQPLTVQPQQPLTVKPHKPLKKHHKSIAPHDSSKETLQNQQDQPHKKRHPTGSEDPERTDSRMVHSQHYHGDRAIRFRWFFCSPVYLHVFDAVTLAIFVIVQLELLNYFIIHFNQGSETIYYYLLIIPDSMSVFLYLNALYKAYIFLENFYKTGKRSRYSKRVSHVQSTFGVMPLCYISWIFYAIVIIIKLGIIFKTSILQRITTHTHDFIGPQLLNVAVGASAYIFLLLAEGHNWAKIEVARNKYVTHVCYQTGIDLIDSCSLLGSVFYHPIHSSLEDGVLILVFLNFFLPAMKLYRLSLADMSLNKIDQVAIMMYVILYMMLITIPSIFVRLHLWLHYHEDASLFLMKNFLDIIVTCRSVIPNMISLYKRGEIE